MNDVRLRGKKQIYILKPDAGCQGKGIKLVQVGVGGMRSACKREARERAFFRCYTPPMVSVQMSLNFKYVCFCAKLVRPCAAV